jgi:hypothetical protein
MIMEDLAIHRLALGKLDVAQRMRLIVQVLLAPALASM